LHGFFFVNSQYKFIIQHSFAFLCPVTLIKRRELQRDRVVLGSLALVTPNQLLPINPKPVRTRERTSNRLESLDSSGSVQLAYLMCPCGTFNSRKDSRKIRQTSLALGNVRGQHLARVRSHIPHEPDRTRWHFSFDVFCVSARSFLAAARRPIRTFVHADVAS
jgi:hypothetical protein